MAMKKHCNTQQSSLFLSLQKCCWSLIISILFTTSETTVVSAWSLSTMAFHHYCPLSWGKFSTTVCPSIEKYSPLTPRRKRRRSSGRHCITKTSLHEKQWKTPQLYSVVTTDNDNYNYEDEAIIPSYKVIIKGIAASGIVQNNKEKDEVNAIKEAIYSACEQLYNGGLEAHFSMEGNEDNPFQLFSSTVASKSVPGSTGRVLLLQADIITTTMTDNEDDNDNDDGIQFLSNEEKEELLEQIKIILSQELDEMLFQQQRLTQPILVSVIDVGSSSSIMDFDDDGTSNLEKYMESVVLNEVEQYDMAVPIPSLSSKLEEEEMDGKFIPSVQVEVDGAMITMPKMTTSGNQNEVMQEEEVWDTSTILVFDDVVSNELRTKLLNVVLGRDDNDDNYWDDIQNGPDPKRWQKGGLIDLPTSTGEENDNTVKTGNTGGSGVGLSDDAIFELCFQHNDALHEFESQVLSNLFPNNAYKICRLPPNVVLGENVSPLTANAPVSGDVYSYHIDADPNMTPPSPWTDVYGRYMNRCRGKPRFMSCLVYLNDEWNYEEWGGPTRFLDVATDRYYDVAPKPGRVVVMDQDVTHSVVAPNSEAGNRPRYSLVWKLVLHPVEAEGQDMTFRRYCSDLNRWPEPVLFGSAQRCLQDEEGGEENE